MYYIYDKSQELIVGKAKSIENAWGFIENTEQIDLANDLFEPNNYTILTAEEVDNSFYEDLYLEQQEQM